MNINEQYEQTSASYRDEAEKLYAIFAYWHDKLGGHDDPIVARLHTEWRYARQRAEELYDSEGEA